VEENNIANIEKNIAKNNIANIGNFKTYKSGNLEENIARALAKQEKEKQEKQKKSDEEEAKK